MAAGVLDGARLEADAGESEGDAGGFGSLRYFCSRLLMCV